MGKGDLEDLGVDERIILKRMLQKQGERVCLTELMWSECGPMAGEHGNGLFPQRAVLLH
jgi:hypothetical protein